MECMKFQMFTDCYSKQITNNKSGLAGQWFFKVKSIWRLQTLIMRFGSTLVKIVVSHNVGLQVLLARREERLSRSKKKQVELSRTSHMSLIG